MEVVIKVVAIIDLLIWATILYFAFKKTTEARKNPMLKDGGHYYEMKKMAKRNPNAATKIAFQKRRTFRVKSFIFWIFTLIVSAVVIISFG